MYLGLCDCPAPMPTRPMVVITPVRTEYRPSPASHAMLNQSPSRRFLCHPVNRSMGRITTQHTTPFADENMLMVERPAQIMNLVKVPKLDLATRMQVVTQRMGR